jgi:hypothetical protein
MPPVAFDSFAAIAGLCHSQHVWLPVYNRADTDAGHQMILSH